MVAKLLFASKRARPDISTTIAFLCTRVDKSGKEDWKKLRRLLEYIHRTMNIERVIGANGLDQLFTCVDASHAIHADIKGHAGGLITLGRGVTHSKSSK